MMTMRKITLCAVLVAASPAALPAQNLPGGLIPTADKPPTRQGTRGANFLEIGVGARANGVGGAAVSFIEGGPAETSTTFFLRGILSPFAHVMFTSVTGFALGLAARRCPPSAGCSA